MFWETHISYHISFYVLILSCIVDQLPAACRKGVGHPNPGPGNGLRFRTIREVVLGQRMTLSYARLKSSMERIIKLPRLS